MASFATLSAVTSGIAQYLTRAHQLSAISATSCAFQAAGTTDFKKLDGKNTTCSIFLYRLTHNEHVRNLPGPRHRHLAVNAHLLVTIWADTPVKEQTLLGWVSRELYSHPVLDRSILAASGQWSNADEIQLIPEELTLDDMTKLWQCLVPPYRPSVTYVARNVPIGPDEEKDYAPVIASRYELTDEMESV